MNTMEIIREIKEKGKREFYYRFTMVVPRKFLGRGRTFNGIAGKGEPFDRTTSWYRDDCKIPMSYVDGIELMKVVGGYAFLSLLVDEKDITYFGSEMGREIQSFDYDVSIGEALNDI